MLSSSSNATEEMNEITARDRERKCCKFTMRSAKTTARLTQRNIFKNNISAGQTSLLQVTILYHGECRNTWDGRK